MERSNSCWDYMLRRRELGHPRSIGDEDSVNKHLYTSIKPFDSWDPIGKSSSFQHGGVFNLEFSPDGSMLVAATEKRSILVFDSLNHKLINIADTGHSDCVNCARFLDSRTFATCSDDTTVALWDIRYLKRKLRTLKGHSNWVKNIDYSDRTGLLVTSGFDGSIYTWDINRYTESDTEYQRVFHTNGLMRTKLSPDGTKLLMSTTSGYMMAVHDLNLYTLAADLFGFKPNTYRVMQMGNCRIPTTYAFNHVFTSKRNRIELISDFPNDAEMISSLQVHPQGWCVLSRNTSSDENSEWSCVHDIQDIKSENKEQIEQEFSSDDDPVLNESSARTSGLSNSRPVVHISVSCVNNDSNENRPSNDDNSDVRNSLSSAANANNSMSSSSSQNTSSFRFGNVRVRISRHSISMADNTSDVSLFNASEGVGASSDNDISESTSSASDDQSPTSTGDVNIYTRLSLPDASRSTLFIRASSNDSARTVVLLRPQDDDESNLPTTRDEIASTSSSNASKKHTKVRQNLQRLTHYVEEPNVGRGFIKELCFSSDGRIVCSPFGYGYRLLAFNKNCSEVSDCVPVQPVRLHEVGSNMSHSNVVVCSKFSPHHNLLVTGCLAGKICFHQPVF